MTTVYGGKAHEELVKSFPLYTELLDDEQGKDNHIDCEAGVDTKKRFSVKCVDGAYLWHCYHCGHSGYYRDTESIRRLGVHEMPSVATSTWKGIYENVEHDFDKFSIESQMWLGQYNFDKRMCDVYGIGNLVTYTGTNATVLPIINNSNMWGIQLRNHQAKATKYTTYRDTSVCILNNSSRYIYIVEDLLSAYKLHYAGATVICPMGTYPPSASDVGIALNHASIKGIVIWLDNDEAGINGSIKMYKELAYTGLTRQNITQGRRQPKETSLLELKELINNVV